MPILTEIEPEDVSFIQSGWGERVRGKGGEQEEAVQILRYACRAVVALKPGTAAHDLCWHCSSVRLHQARPPTVASCAVEQRLNAAKYASLISDVRLTTL